ncbi:hypothetical protein NM688_g2284 [Phlebia brevispora]|uniref:Uncharacterized protein n=1 Tax=Phlebia brevispora TaxID=194682 RepID=A0ACC1T907_9APHY|nr:hypothetical protein NM688_g2284 [Phlebia brevispora]
MAELGADADPNEAADDVATAVEELEITSEDVTTDATADETPELLETAALDDPCEDVDGVAGSPADDGAAEDSSTEDATGEDTTKDDDTVEWNEFADDDTADDTGGADNELALCATSLDVKAVKDEDEAGCEGEGTVALEEGASTGEDEGALEDSKMEEGTSELADALFTAAEEEVPLGEDDVSDDEVEAELCAEIEDDEEIGSEKEMVGESNDPLPLALNLYFDDKMLIVNKSDNGDDEAKFPNASIPSEDISNDPVPKDLSLADGNSTPSNEDSAMISSLEGPTSVSTTDCSSVVPTDGGILLSGDHFGKTVLPASKQEAADHADLPEDHEQAQTALEVDSANNVVGSEGKQPVDMSNAESTGHISMGVNGVPSGPPNNQAAMDGATTTVPTGTNAPLVDVDTADREDARVDTTSIRRIPLDLVNAVRGLYRILDLVSEPGSGGLVDKIIIAQESFGRFANDICPGSYQSMTHVKFSDLDKFSIKPLGIYGSKEEIVRFLKDLDVIDEDVSRLLVQSKDDTTDATGPVLRAGLYFLCDPVQQSTVYVVFWPESTTWDDNATSSVQRNRVTFMRYLTKITDQVVALISDEHANTIVWAEEDDSLDCDEDENDRLFTFNVAKTKEQEEGVSMRPGFEVCTVLIDDCDIEVNGILYAQVQHPSIKLPAVDNENPLSREAYMPRLVSGETCIGFLTATYRPSRDKELQYRDAMTSVRLRDFLREGSFQLHSELSESALEILLEHGLDKRALDQVKTMREQRAAVQTTVRDEASKSEKHIEQDIERTNPSLVSALSAEMAAVVINHFGCGAFEMDKLVPPHSKRESYSIAQADEMLSTLAVVNPKVNEVRRQIRHDSKLKDIASKKYKKAREHLWDLRSAFDRSPELSESDQRAMVESPPSHRHDSSHTKGGLVHGIKSSEDILDIDDKAFLGGLPEVVAKYPVLASLAEQVFSLASEHFASHINKEVHKFAKSLEDTQRNDCKKQVRMSADHQIKAICDSTRTDFLHAVQDVFIKNMHEIVIIRNVQEQQNTWSSHNHYNYTRSRNGTGYAQYVLNGTKRTQDPPSVQHIVRTLQLTEGDKHASQLDQMHVPRPRVYDNSSFTFGLSLSQRILHIQLLDGQRCLLVVEDADGVAVYLEQAQHIAAAAERRQCKKQLRRERVGNDVLMAYDESKRMLAVCAVEKMMLHIFVFDEHFKSLQGYGSAVDLRAWYDLTAELKLLFVVFRGGGHEELALADQAGRIRTYSFATQQFRPAIVQLQRKPLGLVSSPDGSCLSVLDPQDDSVYLQAYHWSSFGSTQGISLDLSDLSADFFGITSFVNRSRCHFVGLDISQSRLQSVLLDITHKATEFTFKADRQEPQKNTSVANSAHNSLIDCHRDVWTRFPVVPAVQRRTNQLAVRQPHALTFVSKMDPELFAPYFGNLVRLFQTMTRKPVDGVLDDIQVCGTTYRAFLKQKQQNLSLFTAGDWLVNTLCLIPIHLAVARDNRFVPLKDGVWSTEQERSLLGATVDQVIDNLTFGWYESIFQSYMASKPVRVVSSMGEQSVGKSFALNHLVDTSFAGSAMRTTEGVWMSVTPTDEALIVALDFEGVHSIERSAQEDSLLVLFNTALSNLVLFRNNFALSRDITGLFQSFQSSATVLDPASNPSLFKSTLVIIIKDVVDSDKKEITKEFSLKFQRIVEVEQESNFISRLHAGKLAIIPWPVIESRQFYSLFPTLKKMLDRQIVTHPKGGIFLQTMKTLMAKLKTNDWGALDQNLASHRMQQLLNLLPSALKYGAVEVEPDFEPLMDLDNGLPIDLPDTDARFYVPSTSPNSEFMDQESSDRYLYQLQIRWNKFSTRQKEPEATWTEELGLHLAELARLRVEHVQRWLSANMARFQSDSTVFDTIGRAFETMAVTLRVNIQLCNLQCAECQLLCLLGRHHEGPHNCRTNHSCIHDCQFAAEHGESLEHCGLPVSPFLGTPTFASAILIAPL